jgi:sigma-B regulation protein RsbU (phosphoserine phosphatase)
MLDRNTAALTCTNAGHNPPILYRADGSIEMLKRGGLLIGMLPGQVYEQETVTLGPGDLVVLYTDGITESEGPIEISDADDDDGNMFGEERLIATIRTHAHLSAAGLREAILGAVQRHAAGVAQSDDITLVVIKRAVA